MSSRLASHTLALLSVFSCHQSLALAQAPELRGVWVARDGLTSRQKIIDTLDQFAAAHVNVVCVDVWTRGYTIHPSDVMLATCGVSQDPDPAYVGRDPFGEFVFEAHRRGIEVEAWFEYGFMFGWSGWYAGPLGVGPVLTAHPSWIARDQNGNSQVSDGGSGWFTWAIHEHPEVRQFLIDLAVEVVDRYDVDGVQFDRVRYPSTAFGYDATTSAAYLAATGSSPPVNPDQAAWKQWRADGLTSFHASLYAAIKARRSSVRVTNAPVTMPLAFDSFLQDWPEWVAAGAVDFVYPQVYRTTTSAYTTSLDQQLAYLTVPQRQKVAPGIRAISGTPTSAVLGMVAANRTRNLPGHVFWYAEGLYDDLPQLTTSYFQTDAAVPGHAIDWRPQAVEREDDDPTTVATSAFLPTTAASYSGGHALLALPFASANDHVTWTLPVTATGAWTIYMHVPSGQGLSTAAPCTIEHAGGTSVSAIDQSATSSQGWRELGTFWLMNGSTTVQLGAVPGEAVIADAAMLLRSRWPSGSMTKIGSGTGGTLGGMRIAMSGQARIGGALAVQGNRVLPGSISLLALGFTGASVPLFGGTLHLVPAITHAGLADQRGVLKLDVGVPFAPALVGAQLFAQGLAFDAAGPGGISLSPGAVATFAGN